MKCNSIIYTEPMYSLIGFSIRQNKRTGRRFSSSCAYRTLTRRDMHFTLAFFVGYVFPFFKVFSSLFFSLFPKENEEKDEADRDIFPSQ